MWNSRSVQVGSNTCTDRDNKYLAEQLAWTLVLLMVKRWTNGQ